MTDDLRVRFVTNFNEFKGCRKSRFFPNSNSFGVVSHSKDFGAELRTLYGFLGQIRLGPPAQVSGSLWSSGADLLGCQKVLSKVPPSLL